MRIWDTERHYRGDIQRRLGHMTFIMVKEDSGIRIASNLAVISILGISIN